MKLWQKVTLGLVLGVLVGIVFGEQTIAGTPVLSYIEPMGTIFINLIKMIIIPLIFFSLVAGITSVTDSQTLKRLGIKSTVSFIIITILAVTIGLLVANIMQPGKGMDIDFDEDAGAGLAIAVSTLSFKDILIGIVPSNAIEAMAQGKLLQVVFFAIFTGITLNAMGKEGKRLVEICQNMSHMVLKMIAIIIEFSPYGAFALTAVVVGNQGLEVMAYLGKLIIAVIAAMSIQYLVFGILIWIFGRLSPFPFYRKSLGYQALAFSTSSSKATLATAMKVCQEEMGISQVSTSFVLPLGVSINMDGMAIYLGMCAVFLAQAVGMELHFQQYAMIIFTATLGSIGAAGIPGGAIIMLPIVLASVNLPLEGVALITGIDRILDMIRTTINITGDATITLIVDKSEGTLDIKKYYA